MTFINTVRTSAGDDTYSFDTSSIAKRRGFKAAHFNAARTAIGSTTSHGTLPDTAATGSPIYGEKHFDRIRDAINDAAAAIWSIGDPDPDDYGQQTNEEG